MRDVTSMVKGDLIIPTLHAVDCSLQHGEFVVCCLFGLQSCRFLFPFSIMNCDKVKISLCFVFTFI